jgi:purine-binding chemotaxis protein CheW
MNAAKSSFSPAAPAQDAKQGDETAQFLTFMLAGEMFGINILAVKEIIEYHGVTDVPMMPPSIRGVINLRGAVVPVADLQACFGRPPTEVGRRTCIVIVETNGAGAQQVVGVVVDSVSAVLDIPASEIEPPPSFGTGIRSDFVQGMGKVKGRFVILLDVNQVLNIDELGAMQNLHADADPVDSE